MTLDKMALVTDQLDKAIQSYVVGISEENSRMSFNQLLWAFCIRNQNTTSRPVISTLPKLQYMAYVPGDAKSQFPIILFSSI